MGLLIGRARKDGIAWIDDTARVAYVGQRCCVTTLLNSMYGIGTVV